MIDDSSLTSIYLILQKYSADTFKEIIGPQHTMNTRTYDAE